MAPALAKRSRAVESCGMTYKPSRLVAAGLAAALLSGAAARANEVSGDQLMAQATPPRDSSIETLRGLLWAGRTSSARLVEIYQAAITRGDKAGPTPLAAVLVLNPAAAQRG